MARYRGPRVKVCRTLGVVLPGLTNEAALKRPYPPGQHGEKRRGKQSDYKVRMLEKQKLRFHFGILERQFRRYVAEASRLRGPTGRNLARLLESRLDNVVWRLGLAATIPAARQLVVHGHILVDGKRVDRPSYNLSPGQEIAISERVKTKPFVAALLEGSISRVRPQYLEFDPAKARGRMITSPELEDMPLQVNTQAVVEFYSQQL